MSPFRLLPLLCCLLLPAGATADVTVFAAASLKTALDNIVEVSGQPGVAVSYAGSSALARQIEHGAPAQVFISANTAWMDHVEDAGLIAPGTRHDLLTNRLALIAAPGNDVVLPIGPDMDLASALNGGRLAMALVDAVPAGIYGKAALTALGQWDRVQPQVAQADNVRAALRLVALGEAPLGLVYATDAVAEPRVRVVGLFDTALHPAIVYPAALIKGGDTPEARAFLEYLSTDTARAIFKANGFSFPEGQP
ncbi:MAG: molybdate ABC transporter substrate-binding protein [Pseudooceanicola sp.]|jgi:molybdate transport system substrate-binding protein|nr:molybdate ABC transporter substrate-binding protein [Pseudooceanicola sp.]